MSNYKKEFETKVNSIIERTRNGELPLEKRIAEAKLAVDEYSLRHAEAVEIAQWRENKRAEQKGGKPRELPISYLDANLIERLTNAILHEDLTNMHPDKMTREDYPIMSETQLARRREGKHVEKGKFAKGEVPIGAAALHGTDGKDHRTPKRRPLTTKEAIAVDYESKSRNKARQRKYREFTKAQPVTVTKLSPAEMEAYLNGDKNILA